MIGPAIGRRNYPAVGALFTVNTGAARRDRGNEKEGDMRRRAMVCTVVALLLLALGACAAPPPSITPTPAPPTMTPVPPELAQLATQRARWQTLGITDYDIVVRETHAFGIDVRQTVTVRGGQVQKQETSCSGPGGTGGSCYTLSRYTVPDLFDLAEQFIRGQHSDQLRIRTPRAADTNGTTVQYDPTYAFPSTIAWNLPDVADEKVTIRVYSLIPIGPATPAPATPTRP